MQPSDPTIIPTTKYDGLKLEEYKGAYSLLALRVNPDGDYWPVWAIYRKGKESYQDKAWPVKVNLGNRTEAIAALEQLLASLKAAGKSTTRNSQSIRRPPGNGQPIVNQPPLGEDEGEDVPF